MSKPLDVHELAKSADVAIESFGTGVAERLTIDADTLRALNKRMIHCSISGFGRCGPLKNAPGYDVILQAFSGVMSMTGDEGGGHIRSPISAIDQMTGVHAFSGILACLLAREKSGKGAALDALYVDCLFLNTIISWVGRRFSGTSQMRSHSSVISITARKHQVSCPRRL